MSHIFALANDFIERMTNPAYGISVNEDYALRFGQLLSSKEFRPMLAREVGQIRDPNLLTPHGWLWLLRWARSNNAQLDENLLLNLTVNEAADVNNEIAPRAQAFSDVFMQVAVIDAATCSVDWERQETVADIREFKNSFLSRLMQRCVETRRPGRRGDRESFGEPHPEEPERPEFTDSHDAERVLVALLQVNRDITLDAARSLLNYSWTGQRSLLEHFWLICNELDAETRENWVDRLRPPELPESNR